MNNFLVNIKSFWSEVIKNCSCSKRNKEESNENPEIKITSIMKKKIPHTNHKKKKKKNKKKDDLTSISSDESSAIFDLTLQKKIKEI